ncbi:MAG: hypothetical protein H0X66_18730 [Verrucomicrobia bacterium]|nr:hypothetical protein [Verrucomicrobiota bacterium]
MANEISEALRKFFSPKEEVYSQWYSSVDNFQFGTSEFYQMIEKELTARKVPGLEMSRIEFSEGGLLSNKREYLRLKRERLVFDICAAPFGTSYFFSFRSVQLPLGIKPMELLIFLIGLALVFGLLAKLLGTIYGLIALLAIIGSSVYVMRNSLALELKDLDSSLLKTPVIGPLYEVFLRKETYYRQDTRQMYLTTVDAIARMLVEEVTAAKGIKLLKQYERKPPGGDMFQATIKRLDANATPFEAVA